jgi:hypothetical protein
MSWLFAFGSVRSDRRIRVAGVTRADVVAIDGGAFPSTAADGG